MCRQLAIAAILVLMVSVSLSLGATASVSGNWSDPVTWGGNPEPTAADGATINNNVTVTIDQAGEVANTLRFGQAGLGLAQLNVTGGSLAMDGDTYNGVVCFLSGQGQSGGGSSVINQSGGIIQFGVANARDLSVGPDGGNIGIYNLSGGSATVTRHLDLGNNSVDNQNGGSGALNLSGTGLMTVNQWVKLGNTVGSTGTITIDGGGELRAGAMVNGYVNGVGSVVQNNGIVRITSFYTSALWGDANTGKSEYTLNNGQFIDNGDFSLNESKPGVLATFTQNNGSAAVGNTFIGRGGPGLYTINAGTLTINGGLQVGLQGGGIVVNGGTVSTNNYIAMGYGGDAAKPGYIYLNGGTFNANGEFSVNETKSVDSVVNQTGGTMNLSGSAIYIGRSNTGRGVYTLTGGTLNSVKGDWFRVASFHSANTRGEFNVAGGVVNIGGSGAGENTLSSLVVGEGNNGSSTGVVNQSGGAVNIVATSRNGLWLGNNNGASGTYNLNGGVLTTPKIDVSNAAGTGTKAFNFGGGTLRANAPMTVPAASNFTTAINAGGATIDTNGFSIAWNSPLVAGTTNAVTGISGLVGGSGYTEPPTVTISGGGGGGATALATVVNGAVHDVVITNPGSGYNPATTTFSFSGGSPTVPASATPMVTAGPGGLTKTGAGTLVLGGASTYAGPTVISGGTLRVAGGSLQLWLDAADTSTITSASGNVSQWRDKSGTVGGPGLATVNQNPAFGVYPQSGVDSQNGKNVIRFTGNTGLKGPPVLAANDDDYTYFAVWKPLTIATHDVIEQNASVATGSQRAALLAVGSAYGFNGEGNDRHDLVPYTANVWRTTSMEINNALFDGTNNVRLIDNGAPYLGRTGNPGGLNVGAGGIAVGYKLPANAECLNGDIAELLVYDSILSTADRTAVLNYLNYKWFGVGSPTTLPAASFSNYLPTSTAVSVAAGAILDLNGSNQTLGGLSGGGSVITGGGALTVTGVTAPGSLIGTLTVTGDLNIDGTWRTEADGTGSGSTDLLAVSGLLDISGASVDFDVLATLDDPAYVFAQYGTLGGTAFANVIDLPSGYKIDYDYHFEHQIALVQADIPEPATMAMLGLALASVGGYIRRRRR